MKLTKISVTFLNLIDTTKKMICIVVLEKILCVKIGKTNLPKDPKNPVVARRNLI